ncbi:MULTISPECIES: diguanylate cyclase domain-containing protein [unclassified Sphingopyxis]|uniref:diguanylate cyclase domain-containing protein n=1 Tax=unclassified Sphingopyxis TaxID=2614943 RepID=UPI00285DB705|nr:MULTISPECIES: diguanylate cyclase [unclassified Sphingopyxis]MDR6834320.1 diguanylate cyclase (GGDEF)-like protein [Sphingopyxis sp. BE122]MDR7226589.1 diguanylate cyclase (GGDEF)-like protein [Sphingopyxis sp. BE259]
MTGKAPERIGARTTLQKLLSRFHFGITLFAVALSGLTILLAGVTALRGYADRNMELAAQLGAYGVEPALVFNDPQAAREGLEPLTRIPGIARLRVLNDRGQPLTQWASPVADPAPLLTRMFFPRPFAVSVERNGSAIGTIEVWGDSSTLIDYVRIGLLAGLCCLLVTALGTIFLARRFEYELVKPLNEIATVAHDVRLHRRFDKRVKPLGIAELDRLGGDINALLDELQGWQGHMESERAVLAHRASHDTLTAMPNRHAFDEQLAQRIATAETRGDRFALLFIDADNFKAANDSFGHAAGDAVLVALAACIKDTLRNGDFAARIGGDEFIVLVDPLDTDAVTQQLTDHIRTCVAQPVALPGGATYRASVSVGAAVYPDDGSDATALLTAADAAMYADKLSHRSNA